MVLVLNEMLKDNELRVSGGTEFHNNRGAMTEKALYPDIRTYICTNIWDGQNR